MTRIMLSYYKTNSRRKCIVDPGRSVFFTSPDSRLQRVFDSTALDYFVVLQLVSKRAVTGCNPINGACNCIKACEIVFSLDL